VGIEYQKKRFGDALSRIAGDLELLIALAEFVVVDAPEVLAELRAQVAAGQLRDVAATAHKLKGMLSTFETGGPVMELQEVINAAKDGSWEECRSAFRQCDDGISFLINEIATLQNDCV